jgi:hypothetical protein
MGLLGGRFALGWVVLSGAAIVASAGGGCGGGTTSGFGNNGNPDASTDASGGDDTSNGDDQSLGDDVGSFGDTGGMLSYGCSPDLQNVVDGNGTVVQKCASDQGCAGGKCIAACDAAAQSKGNVACDFVVPTPSFYVDIAPPCWAVFLANNWPHDAKITVQWNGKNYDVTQFGRIPDGTPNAASWQPVPATGLPSNKVAVLFIEQDPSSVNATPLTCPVTPAVSQADGTAVYYGMSANDTGIGHAWHISTDIPVSAYDILPYGGASSYLPSAELVIPTTAWGTNYIAVLPRPTSGPPWGQIVAAQDGTTVKIVPTAALPAGMGVTGGAQNVVTSLTLNAGEFVQWQWMFGGGQPDMTGSIISSNKPIEFTGGTGYLCLSSATSTGGGCDSGHQMIPPIAAMGFSYVAPPFATRQANLAPESIPYRLVGTVAGTKLTYDPPQASAPATVGVGQLLEFESTQAFVVSSQDNKHPFYLGQHMPGCNVTGGSRPGCSANNMFGGCCLGDEEFVNILPPAQWLSKYVFFTDPTYPTTNLVLVREKTMQGFQDVSVDCIGKVTGWQKVDAKGDFQITNVDLLRGTPIGSCTNGGHVASSAGPFGLMVWGLDSYSSYAYPAGGNVAPINTVVVPPNPQ